MAINTEDNLGPMKLIFNYNNVFYSFFYDDVSGCIHRSREFALNYVYSGEMILDNGDEKIHVRKGLATSRVSPPVDKLSVVITILLAFFILKEPLTPKIILGALLITSGSIIMLWE